MITSTETNTGTHFAIPFVLSEILCVDDGPSVLSAFKRLLSATVYEVFHDKHINVNLQIKSRVQRRALQVRKLGIYLKRKIK
ncbi:hypothetical protein SAMN05421760_11081 [Neptunomonas antarctica]|uniref:Uncharacterized protein n=1 Tax=Neptunomonas antarctica TaxID=619304 RepID=A0A1N7NNE3_9GAMM|nr:hypothetical protein SAMN05421760_11081 [Neptunomonas antarctica]